MSAPKLAAVKADDSAAVTTNLAAVTEADWSDGEPVAAADPDALAVRSAAGALLAHRLWQQMQDLPPDTDDGQRAKIGAELGRVVHDTAAARAELLDRYVRTTVR